MGKNIYKHTHPNGKEYYNDSYLSDQEQGAIVFLLLPFTPVLGALILIIIFIDSGFNVGSTLFFIGSLVLSVINFFLTFKEGKGCLAATIGMIYAFLFICVFNYFVSD